MPSLFQGILWFFAYLTLVLLPLAVALLTDPIAAPRPLTLEFAAAAGFLAFTLLALEFALVGRLRAATEPFGMDAMTRFHRHMGIVATGFVLAHVLALALHRSVPAMLNPFQGSLVARSGATAMWALAALAVTSFWRRRLRLSYGAWQAVHALSAVTVIVASLVHILAVKGYSRAAALRGSLVLYAVLFLALLVRHRVWRPLRVRRRPWEVAENRDEGGDTRTLVLRPDGHDGLRFEPGQFVWLATTRHPFVLEQHPISIASSAERPDRLELSIKALGDWSRGVVPAVEPGRRVWIDGPYGAFTPDRMPGQAFMLIAGGVGVTPMRSILLTMRDREDPRPVTLVYAANSPARMIYAEEFRALEQAIRLTCVFVFETPPPDWAGERGLLTEELLRRHLPRRPAHAQYFVCGPDPMMDIAERSLRGLGVPAGRICTERFNMG